MPSQSLSQISGNVRYVPLIHPRAAPPSRRSAAGGEGPGRAAPADLGTGVPDRDAPVDWDERYRRGWAYGKEPHAFVVQVAERYLTAEFCSKAPLRVLSLGEGQGRYVVNLRRR